MTRRAVAAADPRQIFPLARARARESRELFTRVNSSAIARVVDLGVSRPLPARRPMLGPPPVMLIATPYRVDGDRWEQSRLHDFVREVLACTMPGWRWEVDDSPEARAQVRACALSRGVAPERVVCVRFVRDRDE